MGSMETEILSHEKLFRAIKRSTPVLWDNEKNKPSSAAFKDSNGVSVDRDADRSNDQIKESFSLRFGGEGNIRSVIYVLASTCLNHDINVEASPLPDNEFHAEIFRSADNRPLSNSQAKYLASNCIITCQSDD